MIVKLHLFAAARDIMGQEVIDFCVDDGATVGKLKILLGQRHPQMKELVSKSAVSVERKYATDDQELIEGAEVGIIPPVSGG